MTESKRKALITFAFCLLVGGFVLIDSMTFPETQGQGFGSGPAFYPQVLAWCLVGLGILSLIQKPNASQKSRENNQSSSKTHFRYGLVAMVLGLSVVYIWLQNLVGFFFAAPCLILAMASAIKIPKNLKEIIIYVVFTLGVLLTVYLIFEVFVGIELPRGSF